MAHIQRCVQDARYLVTSDGRVFSTKSGKQLRPGRSSNGYLTVAFWQAGQKRSQSFCVQYLVAAAFLGVQPNEAQVLHNDGSRENNDASNLRYGTQSDNLHDITRHGRRKFSPAQVQSIRERRAAGAKLADLAREFNSSHNHISHICLRKQYANIC